MITQPHAELLICVDSIVHTRGLHIVVVIEDQMNWLLFQEAEVRSERRWLGLRDEG